MEPLEVDQVIRKGTARIGLCADVVEALGEAIHQRVGPHLALEGLGNGDPEDGDRVILDDDLRPLREAVDGATAVGPGAGCP